VRSHGHGKVSPGSQTKKAKKEPVQKVLNHARASLIEVNVNNFIVRPKRRLVKKYADATAWETLGPDEKSELVSAAKTPPRPGAQIRNCCR